MPVLTVSSNGQILVLPDILRRLGTGAGSQLEIIEEKTAPARGAARRSEDLDPAAPDGQDGRRPPR